jgi:hypothetical protein
MSRDSQIAYQLAPVFVQRVHHQNPRGDFITRIDFTSPGDLTSLLDNWVAVNDPIRDDSQWRGIIGNKEPPEFEHELPPYIYYSVVETECYYFVVYAVYHPQDWKPSDALKRFVTFEGPRYYPGDHEHDMEGALVVARKKEPIEDLRADIIITLSHWNFYSYAFWYVTNKEGKGIPVFADIDENIYRGASENIDGKIQAIWHKDEGGDVKMRPRLFVEAEGHGIKGNIIGREKRIIHYCPSLSRTDEPTMFRKDSPAPEVKLTCKTSLDRRRGGDLVIEKEVYRYKLIDIFERNTVKYPARGLWESRNNRKIFRVNDDGLKCFAVRGKKDLTAGAAKPPWSWDDRDDPSAVKPGWMATHPAGLIFHYGYDKGLVGFARTYVRNKYRGK